MSKVKVIAGHWICSVLLLDTGIHNSNRYIQCRIDMCNMKVKEVIQISDLGLLGVARPRSLWGVIHERSYPKSSLVTESPEGLQVRIDPTV